MDYDAVTPANSDGVKLWLKRVSVLVLGYYMEV